MKKWIKNNTPTWMSDVGVWAVRAVNEWVARAAKWIARAAKWIVSSAKWVVRAVKWVARIVFLILCVLAVITLIIGLVYYFPDLFTTKAGGAWNGAATRNLAFVIGGILAAIGLYLSYWRTKEFSKQVKTGQEQVKIGQEQVTLGQEQQFSEALSRAVDSLGQKDSMTHRNAGLHLFESLATPLEKDSERWKLIVNTLHGFIRERAILPVVVEDKEQLSPPEPLEKRADIVTALEVILRIVPAENRNTIRLSTLDFRKIRFPTDLERVNLSNTNLQGARLHNTNLQGADLTDAKLQGTYLMNSDLQGVDLAGANLHGAELYGANLQDADLWWEVNLEAANLSNANLQGANLFIVNLKNTKLKNADISDVGLRYAENLTQEQLDNCIFEEERPPQNFPKDENGTALMIPIEREYIWKKNDEGLLLRKFKGREEWIDNVTPFWKETEEEGRRKLTNPPAI